MPRSHSPILAHGKRLNALLGSQGPDAGRVEGVLQQHVRWPRAAEQDGAPPRLPGRQRPRRHHKQRLAPDLTGQGSNDTLI